MKKVLALVMALVLVCALVSGCAKKEDPAPKADGSEQDKKLTIVMVAKAEGISWFDDVRLGVEEFGKVNNVNAYQIAPEGGDSAKQVQMVEDLIAQGVDAICVIPNDPQSMKPVLEKAKKAGIVVITHEASDIADAVDYDLEAFTNETFGQKFYEELAKGMGGKGKFASFVGGLTMTTHMQWHEAGLKYLKENYPEMECISAEPYEDKNDIQVAYDKALEILKANPDIKGFTDMAGSGSGIAMALQEKGRNDIFLSTLSIPSLGGTYIKDGFIKYAQCWRPADAGYASAMLAYKILKGEQVSNGVDLGKPGYEKCEIDGKIVYGDAPLALTKDNVDQLKF